MMPAAFAQRGPGVIVQRLQMLGVVRPQQAGGGLLHQSQRQAEVRVDGFVATPPRPRDLHVAAAAALAAVRSERPQRHRGTAARARSTSMRTHWCPQ
jgi:hypothetical protein